MAKYLVYLGKTPANAYRLALFDDKASLNTSRLPVKDVTEFPSWCNSNWPMLNFILQDGIPQPSINGKRALCCSGFDRLGAFVSLQELEGVTLGAKQAEARSAHRSRVTALDVWNGVCQDNDWYLLARVVARDRYSSFIQLTDICLLVDGEGRLALLGNKDVKTLIRGSKRLIFTSSSALCAHGEHRVIPYAIEYDKTHTAPLSVVQRTRKGDIDIPCDRVSALWGLLNTPSPMGGTVTDLRNYKNTEVFGLHSIVDTRAVIFPESTKEVWMGFIQDTPSLRFVYLPTSVECMRTLSVPKRRIALVTLYSDSPAVAAFAKEFGVPCVPASGAEEMLAAFYKSSNPAFVSADEASAIGTLTNFTFNSKDDVIDAVALSCRDTGFAGNLLKERFPVVDTLSDLPPYPPPTPEKCELGRDVGGRNYRGPVWQYPDTPRALEYARLFVALLTQLYPRCNPVSSDCKYEQYDLGEYRIYLPKVPFLSSGAEPTPTGQVLIEHIPSARIIHCFEWNRGKPRGILWCFHTLAARGAEPCAVLRYADKLTMWHVDIGLISDKRKIQEALFTSFLPVLYGTRQSKRQILGVDLHTGNFVTAAFAPVADVDGFAFKSALSWFPNVDYLIDITTHLPDWDVSALLPVGCAYLSAKNA
jgi:hypothetical protein